MKWKYDKLYLTIDVTTHCNAKCPQCARTDFMSGGLKKVKSLPLVHWTLADIKKAYPADQIDCVGGITMSGIWGDAMMNPHIYDITDYFLNTLSEKTTVSIITNGSIRDEEFWWKFGYLAIKHNTKTLDVCFDIDGIDQEMHSRYRKNTNLSKILNNMLAFSDNGKSTVRCQTIIFKHNQKYLKQILNLTKKFGSQSHKFIRSDRFVLDDNSNYKPFKYLNENGKEEILEWADNEFDEPVPEHNLRKEVVCTWAKKNQIKINYDGQVWPCCYFASKEHHYYDNPRRQNFYNTDIAKKYNDMRLKNNIKHTPLKQILNNVWFNGYLQESISQNPIDPCRRYCSTQIKQADKHLTFLYK